MSETAERIGTLLRGRTELAGVELVHVEYQAKGKPPVLRLVIDKPGGVTHKDCERVSRQASALLDGGDLISHHYVLEVSSPGIERPLFSEGDYRRFAGKEVRLETLEKIGDRRKFRGVIQDLTDGVLYLSGEGTQYRIPFEQIKKATLIHHFE